MRRFLLPVLALVSLTFALSWTLAARPQRPPTDPLYAPPIPSSQQAVAAVGLVEPETENISVSCSVSGLVTAVYVKAGDRVHAGQKLFSLDDRDLQADLRVKQAALDAAQAKLKKLEE